MRSNSFRSAGPVSKLRQFFTTFSTQKAVFVIIFLGLIVFINGTFNQFIGDDIPQVVDNVSVHSIKNIGSFFTGSTFYNGEGTNFTGSYYRPLMTTAFSLVYSFFGPNPYAFHLLQILLHIASAILLFLFLRYFFDELSAFVLAFIFLVHPINSEVVFSVSSMQDVLFFFFGILALWMLVKFQQRRFLPLIILSLWLSLLSKETGVLFFGAAILFSILFRRKSLYAILASSFLSIVGYVLIRSKAIGVVSGQTLNSPIQKLNLMERFWNMPEIFLFYIKRFVFPWNLASSYHWFFTEPTIGYFVLPLAISFLFFGAMIYFARILYKSYPISYLRVYIFFSLWFLAGVLFHLQIIPLDVTVAERWFYFPIVGLLGMIGVLLETINFNWRRYGIFIVIILLILSARTFVRSFDWRDVLTLNTHDIKVSKEAYNLENGISAALMKQGRFQEAKVHAERSVQLYPYVTNNINLGLIYLNLGDYQKAKESYLAALKFGDYYLTYENLGGLALVYGDPSENILFIKDALKKFPQDSKLWLYLSILQYKQGDAQGAKASISQAYRFDSSLEILDIYQTIMSNQPLNLNFKAN